MPTCWGLEPLLLEGRGPSGLGITIQVPSPSRSSSPEYETPAFSFFSPCHTGPIQATDSSVPGRPGAAGTLPGPLIPASSPAPWPLTPYLLLLLGNL